MKVRVQTGELDETVEVDKYPTKDSELRAIFKNCLNKQGKDEIEVSLITTFSKIPRSSKHFPRYWIATKSLVEDTKQ